MVQSNSQFYRFFFSGAGLGTKNILVVVVGENEVVYDGEVKTVKKTGAHTSEYIECGTKKWH